jgi:hypothetical protein
MIENYRFFSEEDLKELLKSQRLNEDYAKHLNKLTKKYISKSNLNNYQYSNNIWKPQNMLRYHPEIKIIIRDLQLHLEVENSLDSFEDTSCDVIQKINNYIFVCELTAI